MSAFREVGKTQRSPLRAPASVGGLFCKAKASASDCTVEELHPAADVGIMVIVQEESARIATFSDNLALIC